MRSMLLVSLALLAGCSAGMGTHREAPGSSASISGKIAYPSEVVPAMRICAMPAQGTPSCIEHAAGDQLYRIDHLATGTYNVVAWLSEGDMRVAGHVHQVQCIRAPCPDMLNSVVATKGADVSGVDITGFYPARADFPAQP